MGSEVPVIPLPHNRPRDAFGWLTVAERTCKSPLLFSSSVDTMTSHTFVGGEATTWRPRIIQYAVWSGGTQRLL